MPAARALIAPNLRKRNSSKEAFVSIPADVMADIERRCAEGDGHMARIAVPAGGW